MATNTVHSTSPAIHKSWWESIDYWNLYKTVEPTVEKIVLILVYYIVARITIRFGVRVLHRFMNSSAIKADARRRATMESLLDNILRYTVYFIFIISALSQIGIHLEALLAGAGIAGVAVGFGAQSLIKDVLTGFFILFEDQYAVGDFVKINGVSGTVQSIGLRLTKLQVWTGEVEIVPNGQIQQVTNYSKVNSLAVIDVSVSHNNNIRHVIEVTEDALKGLEEENENVVAPAQVLGVQQIREFDIVIRSTVECLPVTQAGITRLSQRRIKEAYERAGVELPNNVYVKSQGATQ